jgi:ketosteroid isomerase-like protein
MSENLSLVRGIFADWERGDYSRSEWAHPDHEHEIVGGPTPGRWRGRPAMRNAWREILSAWDDWRSFAERYHELDDGRVLVFSHSTARGRTSGLGIPEAWTKGAVLFEIRDGRVTRHVVYLDGREHVVADLDLQD